MAKNPFQPDYSKKYPGTDIDTETLQALKAGDRKAEYMERDLKRNRYLRDGTGQTIRDENGQPIELPERETSLDALSEAGYPLPIETPSAEDMVIAAEFSEVDELYRCLNLLPNDERALIDAHFFSNGGKGMTEREHADSIGLSKTALRARKKKILAKIKKMMSE